MRKLRPKEAKHIEAHPWQSYKVSSVILYGSGSEKREKNKKRLKIGKKLQFRSENLCLSLGSATQQLTDIWKYASCH